MKGGFESLDKGVLVSLDFSNAFPTLSLTFIEVVLPKIHLPPFHIQFILSSIVVPYNFCVGNGVVREILFILGRALDKEIASPRCYSSAPHLFCFYSTPCNVYTPLCISMTSIC